MTVTMMSSTWVKFGTIGDKCSTGYVFKNYRKGTELNHLLLIVHIETLVRETETSIHLDADKFP